MHTTKAGTQPASTLFLPDDTPIAPSKELFVDVEVDKWGTHEMYIDNLIGISINLSNTNNHTCAKQAPLIAIHTCTHPIHEE